MTCMAQTLSWQVQVVDTWHRQWWHNYRVLIMIWLNNPRFHRPSLSAAHARTRQICARLVGCEGWLGLDGCLSLSLHRPYGVTHTRCVPPPPSDQFHRNRLTMSDVFIHSHRSHVRALSVNLTQYLSPLRKHLGPLLAPWQHHPHDCPGWHVHLSPAIRACKHIMVGDRFVTARSRFFSHCNIGSIIGRESCTTMTSRQNW